MADDQITLTIAGQEYRGWTELKVSRDIEQMASVFEATVSEAWSSTGKPWQITPFSECVVAVDGKPILTGFVESYGPSFDAKTHTVTIGGRSKTCDVVDCMPDIPGGEFVGYTLDKIAKAVCGPFGVNVLVQAPMGAAIPNATLEKTETAHAFLDKLCRLQGILAFDDENGNLILAQAGAQSAAGALIEGDNIIAASGKLSSDKRFQKYIVLAQAPLSFDDQDAQLQIVGTATDAGCPRFRRFAEMAEDPADIAKATQRAKWRSLHNLGESTEATVTVQGWHQVGNDGDLWKVNQLVTVTSPRLAIARSLLIKKVALSLGTGGRRTELTLGPQEAFIPEGTAKKPKGKGSSPVWDGP